MAVANGKLTLKTFADAKKLPIELLIKEGVEDDRRGVRFAYYDLAAELIGYKLRTGGTPPFIWEKKPPAAYGIWRLYEAHKAGSLYLVEGESDTLTLWHYRQPALGIPGANNTKCLEREHLAGITKLYISREPGQGGLAFVEGVVKRLRDADYDGEAFEVTWPTGIKDPSDLHLQSKSKAAFLAALEGCRTIAKQIWPQKNIASARPLPASPSTMPAPIPLTQALDVPDFPIDVFPAPLRRLIDEVVWSMNCPADFAAVPMLTLSGGAIANARHIRITESYTEPPLLFSGIIGSPGTVKSPPLKMLCLPFDAKQSESIKAYKTQMRAMEEADQPQDQNSKPILKRCIVSNVTTEKLGSILADNPRGVAMVQDELISLIAGMNQYKQGGGNDRQFYLSVWSQATITTDRQGDRTTRNGAPLFVKDPFVCIHGNLQDDVLPKLRGESRRGAPMPNDGWQDRFLLVFPKRMAAAGEKWRSISQDAREAWTRTVEELLALEMVSEGEWRRPYYVTLRSCARVEWEKFTHDHAEETNDANFPQYLLGAWAKLRSYCGRLALIVHSLRLVHGDVDDESIDGESLQRAVRLVAFFKQHARKVYSLMDADPRIADARKVFKRIIDDHTERFTKRDVHSCHRAMFQTADDIDPVLAVLERNYLILPLGDLDRGGPGRKSSPAYLVNPLVYEPDFLTQDAPQNTHNTQK